MCIRDRERNRDSIKVKKEEKVIENLIRIIDATLKICSKKSFQAMSIRDLSAESGLSGGALYSYFSSKEELLVLIQTQGREIANRVLVDQVVKSSDPVEKLRIAIKSHIYLSEAMRLSLIHIFKELNEYQFERIMSHYVPLVAQEDASLQPLVEELLTDKRAFQLVFDRVMTRWLGDDSSLEKVEGWIRFKERIEQGIYQITSTMEQNSRVIVFSSGGVISTALHIATGMSPYEAIRIGWGLVNTSMTKFRFGSSGLILHSFNNYPHLEGYRAGELITYR